MAESVILNVRLAPQTKQELTDLIAKISEENDYHTASEAYQELVEIVKRQQSEIHPGFKDQIKIIQTNLNSVLSNVYSMNDSFLSYQSDQEQRQKKDQEGLLNQINGLGKQNKELKEKIKTLEEEVERLNQESEEKNDQLQSYKEQVQKQNQIEKLLDQIKKQTQSVNELLKVKEKNETEEFDMKEQEDLIPGQVDISNYTDL